MQALLFLFPGSQYIFGTLIGKLLKSYERSQAMHFGYGSYHLLPVSKKKLESFWVPSVRYEAGMTRDSSPRLIHAWIYTLQSVEIFWVLRGNLIELKERSRAGFFNSVFKYIRCPLRKFGTS